MTLDEKKAHVLRCVRLGMDFFSSALLAECSEEEVIELEEDKAFQRRVAIEGAIEEERLLRRHNVALEEAAVRGNANPIQWKLERINPRRWGTKEVGANTGEVVGDVTINLIGRKPDGSEC